MNKHTTLIALAMMCASYAIHCMENKQMTCTIQCMEGPMSSAWFYDESNVFNANLYDALIQHQICDWAEAAHYYQAFLDDKKYSKNSDYDKNMVKTNLASCLMAQQQATGYWAAFDALLNIPQERRINLEQYNKRCKHLANYMKNEVSGKTTENDFSTYAYIVSELKNRSALIRTDQFGIGDIFCFLPAADQLKKHTEWNITLAVPKFLMKTLAIAADESGFTLTSWPINEQTHFDYETHLISLLGHLNLAPAQLNPEKVVFTAPEKAINAVWETIQPALANNNIIVIVDRGEVGRQATLIGGKQLPRDPRTHGRHLDEEPFKELIKNHFRIALLDCSAEIDKITVDEQYKYRYFTLPKEEYPFEMIIALGRIMSNKKIRGRMFGFGPDMGQTNVFIRSLDSSAQEDMTLIIPNGQEHDMRMSGYGSLYKHMLSNCWVAKCPTPADQTRVVENSYNRMFDHANLLNFIRQL